MKVRLSMVSCPEGPTSAPLASRLPPGALRWGLDDSSRALVLYTGQLDPDEVDNVLGVCVLYEKVPGLGAQPAYRGLLPLWNFNCLTGTEVETANTLSLGIRGGFCSPGPVVAVQDYGADGLSYETEWPNAAPSLVEEGGDKFVVRRITVTVYINVIPDLEDDTEANLDEEVGQGIYNLGRPRFLTTLLQLHAETQSSLVSSAAEEVIVDDDEVGEFGDSVSSAIPTALIAPKFTSVASVIDNMPPDFTADDALHPAVRSLNLTAKVPEAQLAASKSSSAGAAAAASSSSSAETAAAASLSSTLPPDGLFRLKKYQRQAINWFLNRELAFNIAEEHKNDGEQAGGAGAAPAAGAVAAAAPSALQLHLLRDPHWWASLGLPFFGDVASSASSSSSSSSENKKKKKKKKQQPSVSPVTVDSFPSFGASSPDAEAAEASVSVSTSSSSAFGDSARMSKGKRAKMSGKQNHAKSSDSKRAKLAPSSYLPASASLIVGPPPLDDDEVIVINDSSDEDNQAQVEGAGVGDDDEDDDEEEDEDEEEAYDGNDEDDFDWAAAAYSKKARKRLNKKKTTKALLPSIFSSSSAAGRSSSSRSAPNAASSTAPAASSASSSAPSPAARSGSDVGVARRYIAALAAKYKGVLAAYGHEITPIVDATFAKHVAREYTAWFGKDFTFEKRPKDASSVVRDCLSFECLSRGARKGRTAAMTNCDLAMARAAVERARNAGEGAVEVIADGGGAGGEYYAAPKAAHDHRFWNLVFQRWRSFPVTRAAHHPLWTEIALALGPDAKPAAAAASSSSVAAAGAAATAAAASSSSSASSVVEIDDDDDDASAPITRGLRPCCTFYCNRMTGVILREQCNVCVEASHRTPNRVPPLRPRPANGSSSSGSGSRSNSGSNGVEDMGWSTGFDGVAR